MQSKKVRRIKQPLSDLEVGDSHRFLTTDLPSVEVTILRMMRKAKEQETPLRFKRDNLTEKNVLIITRVE